MLIVIAPQWLYTKNTFRYFWQPFCWIIMSRNIKNYILITENIASLSIMMFFCFPCLCWHNKRRVDGREMEHMLEKKPCSPINQKITVSRLPAPAHWSSYILHPCLPGRSICAESISTWCANNHLKPKNSTARQQLVVGYSDVDKETHWILKWTFSMHFQGSRTKDP